MHLSVRCPEIIAAGLVLFLVRLLVRYRAKYRTVINGLGRGVDRRSVLPGAALYDVTVVNPICDLFSSELLM